jgi:hypothetical protein
MQSLEFFGAMEVPFSYFAILGQLENLENLLIKLNWPDLCDRPAQVNNTRPNCNWKWPKAMVDFLQRGAHQDAKPTAPLSPI